MISASSGRRTRGARMDAVYLMRVVRGLDRGREFRLAARTTVGRGGSDVVLTDPRVSRTHLAVAIDPQGVWLNDLGSATGTMINGQPVRGWVLLPAGAVVGLGDSEVRVLRPVRVTDDRRGELMIAFQGREIGRHVVGPEPLTIGRDETSDVVIRVAAVSRAHLRIRTVDSEVVAEDLGSSNGTLLDGRRLVAPTPLARDAELDLVDTGVTIRFRATPERRSTTEFRVGTEFGGRDWAVRLEGPPSPTIGEVAAAGAHHLGHRAAEMRPDWWGVTTNPRRWTFSRADGRLLHPDDPWQAAAVARGELLTVLASDGVDDAPLELPPPSDIAIAQPPSRPFSLPRDRIDLPRPPAGAEKQPGVIWQIGGGSLGVVAGVVVGAVTGNWLFAVLGAVAGLGAVLFGLAGERSRRLGRQRDFLAQVSTVGRHIDETVQQQCTVHRGRSVRLDQAASSVANRTLWVRSPGDADVGLPVFGWGQRPARLDFGRTGGDEGPNGALVDQLARPRTLDGVPITPSTAGVVGLVGPRRRVLAVAAAVTVEAALSQAPSTSRIAVVAGGPGFEWARWLPHTADVSGPLVSTDAATARALVDRLTAERQLIATVHLVVVAPEAAGLVSGLAGSWTAERGTLLLLGNEVPDLPTRAGALVVVDDQAARLTDGGDDHGRGDHGWDDHSGGDHTNGVTRFVPAALSSEQAAAVALALAPLVDPQVPRRHGTTARGLLELLDWDGRDERLLAERWQRGPSAALAAPIGVDDGGDPVVLDLEADGPHMVIAGTTGSGKSEAIATLLSSLIACHGPERLALFLVDFKGGATMRRFASAPHVVGVVTDLEDDPRLASRAFTSVEAELTRRKRILATAGCADLRTYRATGSPGGVVPSLLVVIDEFAMLVQSQVDARARLDAVAAQGRSLGVHLVLATQSPTGVVSPAIRANTNLWLALRVVGDSESREILGQPDAARIAVSDVGRALLRRGGEDDLRRFRVVRVTTFATDKPTTRLVPYLDPPAEPTAPVAPESSSAGPTALDLVLDTAGTVARRLRYVTPAPLWLPPLPRHLTVDHLPGHGDASTPSAGVPVTLALVDDPTAQRQDRLVVDLATGNLLVSGGPRSGRTTALLQVACSLAETFPPAALHLYALGASDSLTPIESLPHFGGRAVADDPELAPRLLERLTREAERRRAGAPREPRIVLLVDDYALVRDALENGAPGRLVEALAGLVLGGRTVGIHLVVAAGAPTEVRVALLGTFTHRIQLHTQDRSDYLALEWRPGPDEVPGPLPGRGVTLGGREVQLVHADIGRAAAIAAGWPAAGAPVRLGRLPTVVAYDELPAVPGARHPIGITAPDLTPLALPDHPGDHLLVIGGPGSGRTTALRTIARAAGSLPGNRAVVITPGTAAGWGTASVAGTTAEAESWLGVVESGGGAWVIVDDADRLPPQLGDRLDRLLREGRARDIRVVVAAAAAEWSRLYEPWARQLGALRRVLVLAGGRDAAAALDIRIPLAETSVLPGRGHLATPGTLLTVQVADSPTTVPSTPPTGGAPDS